MQQLTQTERCICAFTAGPVAAMVIPPDPLSEFIGIYALLLAAVAFSLYITLAGLLLMLKNEGSWWGW
jgi:hypothetical protein